MDRNRRQHNVSGATDLRERALRPNAPERDAGHEFLPRSNLHAAVRQEGIRAKGPFRERARSGKRPEREGSDRNNRSGKEREQLLCIWDVGGRDEWE